MKKWFKMAYPKYAQVGNEKYPINTDFKVGIKCFEVINDTSISD